MHIFLSIIISAFIVSLVSFFGVLTLFFKEKNMAKMLLFFVAFSAGALIGGAFLHLLPESIDLVLEKNENIINVFLYLIFGFCSFYILEEFISWHHHHVVHCEDCPKVKPFSYLILVSDGIHNFIDGLVIAGAYVVNFNLGIATTLAVIFHEIPQEIGDFGVLVYGGFSKFKALFLNFLSALVAILGAVIGFLISESIQDFSVYFLSFAAGNFIYIAASDLIPEIKMNVGEKRQLNYFIFFLLGLGFMALMKFVIGE